MVEKKCLNPECGKLFKVINSRKDTAKFCSKKCANLRLKAVPNTVCTECGNMFHLKESAKKRYKRTHGYFCSTKCVANYRKKEYIGDGNPNFKNVKYDNGYRLDYLPRFGRIKLHHKVVFEYLNINKIPNKWCVHHRDCNINNNNIDNLVLISQSDHRWLHKNFGNATLWAYYNKKISINELSSWCRDEEKAKKLLPLNIIIQKENKLTYENIYKISQ